MSTVALRRGVLDRLALAGSWVPRAELDALTTCRVALDGVLADLVVEQRAVFKAGVGYRLAGVPLVRSAVRSLYRDGLNRAITAVQQGGQFRLGVAQRVPGGGVVGYVLELPPAADADAELAQIGRLVEFVGTKGCLGLKKE